MKRPTWETFERAAKFIGGMTLAYLELDFWGARPAALTFIATILAGSEALKLAKKDK